MSEFVQLVRQHHGMGRGSWSFHEAALIAAAVLAWHDADSLPPTIQAAFAAMTEQERQSFRSMRPRVTSVRTRAANESGW